MVKKSEQKSLIGDYIRKNVLPAGMSVTKAASLLNVSRPTLSKLLNGNSSLSQEMAQKLERAFGSSARELLELQTSQEASVAEQAGGPEKTKMYVPPFMDILGRDIEEWANHLSARSRLAVLLRILVQSTNPSLVEVNFPGNDYSQRPGWDGYTDAKSGTPWVPAGKAGWEFGVDQEPKFKAEKDYQKNLKLSKSERSETTFIFVTPRRWPSKASWIDTKLKEKAWKNVRVFDACDIEQWLEQSFSAQAWFANETNMPSKGVLSLDACWRNWSQCCDPQLSQTLFHEALAKVKLDSVASKLEQSDTLVVATDSREEGLAFLYVMFSQENPRIAMLRDRIAVFTEPNVLPRFIRKGGGVIPVIVSQEIEKEHAVLENTHPKIVIRSKNNVGSDVDITLDTLSYNALQQSLSEMGLSRDNIDRLVHESGHSLTVLRRRLAKVEAIRIPIWGSNSRYAQLLIPLAFAGAWDIRTKADKYVLEQISKTGDYDAIENNVLELTGLEDPPLWMLGTFRGVVSKLDTLFVIANLISASDLENFFIVAELVLSEDDPALDLPEDERWMANIHGKKREISGTLREGISETLVILSVYGKDLFGNRLGFNPTDRVAHITRKLLTPATGRTFEAHSHDLPMYAEAAPDEFLNILETDLDEAEPAVYEIVRPVSSSMFGSSPRTGLLWALETLAWHPERLIRVVTVLAQLATKQLDDNHANKPTATLSAIFRSWMPQTAASVEDRIAALDHLVRISPQLGWVMCIEQLKPGPRSGHYSYKPRWRTDARGFGEVVTFKEIGLFNRHALDLTLNWPNHTELTLGDLVTCIESMSEEQQKMVWSLISTWAETASDSQKSVLRERVRTTTMTRRAKIRMQRDDIPKMSNKLVEIVRNTFVKLQPEDLVQRHAWLFMKSWVDESVDELVEVDDWNKREKRIARLRKDAIKEIYVNKSIDGLINLAAVGEASYYVGIFAAEVVSSADRVPLVTKLTERVGFQSPGIERGMAAGFFAALDSKVVCEILKTVHKAIDSHQFISLLRLAPFTKHTWKLASELGSDVENAYWNVASVDRGCISDDDREIAVTKLLEVGRPRATFQMIRFDFDKLPIKLLFRILDEVTTSTEDLSFNQLQAYAIKEAFKVLNEKAEIPVSDMAALEFRYMPVFEREEGMIPNLEKQLDQNPDMFAQVVAFVFKRSDGQKDPEEIRAENEELAANRAKHSYRLLETLHRIPGRNKDNKIESGLLVKWIKSARSSLRELGRLQVGDSCIGEWLAKSPIGDDDVWPCESVRDAMEQVLSNKMMEGFRIGKMNLRGVHTRGDGGQQERDLAAEFDQWAQALNSSHPKVAKVLRELRDEYFRDGEWEDIETKIRKRLSY